MTIRLAQSNTREALCLRDLNIVVHRWLLARRARTATPSSRRERDTARQATPGSPALLSVSPTRRARQTLRAY